MDYSNFVRNLFREAFSSLKKYKEYNGRIVNVGKPLSVPNEFLHVEESESMFLPQFSVNIDAKTSYFIDFMEYFVSMMPDLGYVFATKERIGKLYENAIAMGVLENDADALDFIRAVVGVGISSLESMGILQNGY